MSFPMLCTSTRYCIADNSNAHLLQVHLLHQLYKLPNQLSTQHVTTPHTTTTINSTLSTHRFLSFTACRQYLSTDVTSLHSIWTFLNTWGLINYQAADKPAVAASQPAPASLLGLLASHMQPSQEAVLKLPDGSVAAGVAAAAQGGGLHVS